MKIISDDVLAEMKSEVFWLRTQHERLLLDCAELTKQIIELKRDGFARPTPQLAMQQQGPPMDSRIMAAVRSIAPEGSSLERQLLEFAEASLLAEVEVEDVADMILAGSTLGDD